MAGGGKSSRGSVNRAEPTWSQLGGLPVTHRVGTEYERYLLDPTGRPYYTALESYVEKLSEPEATVEGRALGAEAYFDRAATGARRNYLRYSFLQIAFAGLVTVIATASGIFKFPGPDWWPIATAALGAAIVIIRGFDSILPSRDSWVRLRSTQQALLSERIAYSSKTGIYAKNSDALKNNDALNVYASRVEAILNGELAAWGKAATQPGASGSGSANSTTSANTGKPSANDSGVSTDSGTPTKDTQK